MYCGWVFAVLAGTIIPTFIYLTGDVVAAFSAEDSTPESSFQVVLVISIINLALCLAIFVFIYFEVSLTLTSSITMAANLKKKYLAAILKQDCTYFDQINCTELSARLSKETLAIQKATGEKFGQVIFSVGMTVSGMLLGFTTGWSLALAMLIIGPFIFFGFGTVMKVITDGMGENMASYGQSAGYAE